MWQSLVHVCQRWRSLVFRSPRHLNLQLVCTGRTRTRDMLDVWPAQPLVMICAGGYTTVDDAVAVLERTVCVRQIRLKGIPYSNLETLLATLKRPFPELTHLLLETGYWYDETEVVVLPDSFLGGSAPRLRSLQLGKVLFPGLPKLLLSATHPGDRSHACQPWLKLKKCASLFYLRPWKKDVLSWRGLCVRFLPELIAPFSPRTKLNALPQRTVRVVMRF